MPRVRVITLGGTISARGGDATRMSGTEVLAGLGVTDTPDLHVELHDFRRLPSSSLTLEDLAALAHDVRESVAAGYGVTAAFAHLTGAGPA
ncbi:asparaginase domain-containing protein [Streptomyces purpureus]|uniref:L-asparaginase N-terminal domain-containing protein n=1 Tax=Streptomyces purpureus TaxID=1951 RepID=A0A918GYR6_9ACTN|nr:asparaginase domain-containing protein [Streptomyces purpureus]GGT23697.1 hypothetical protein GCM10014713_15800 [Streptomyces purpureus]